MVKGWSSRNGATEIGFHMQKGKVRPIPHTIYQNQFKWIKDLHVRAKTIKNLRRKHRKSFMTLDLAIIFFRYDTKGIIDKTYASTKRKKVVKLEFTKIKNFCT